MDKVHGRLDVSSSEPQDAELIASARRLLKGEWNRIKDALGEAPNGRNKPEANAVG